MGRDGTHPHPGDREELREILTQADAVSLKRVGGHRREGRSIQSLIERKHMAAFGEDLDRLLIPDPPLRWRSDGVP